MDEIDQYISQFPPPVQEVLRTIREVIKRTAPDATEKMAYGMPGYKTHGRPLVYFAAYKNHIGFYPTPSGIKKFEKELSIYKGAKGSVQFPLDQPMPYDLIRKITAFRVKEKTAKVAAKAKAGTKAERKSS